MFLPSTMGMSFLADVSGDFFIEAQWGTYHKQAVPGYAGHIHSQDEAELWFRTPGIASIKLDANQLSTPRYRQTISPADAHGVLVLDVVSRPWQQGRRLITVTLLNATDGTVPINESCFFQCMFSVQPLGISRIHPYPGRPDSVQDAEERSLSLLYRHRPIYAIGHGCAADWEILGGSVQKVRSEVLPTFEQAPILPRESLDGVELSMRRLSQAPPEVIVGTCNSLAAAYRTWIGQKKSELASDTALSAELKEAGTINLGLCRACLSRIEDGISLLRSESDAMKAFQLMNRAMLEQREHYALSVETRTWIEGPNGSAVPEKGYAQPTYPDSTEWRPFQLAFILMNIRAFVDPAHEVRSVVDVIWFPTGGGKTEAYLGLAAFAILLRRLRNPSNAGTTVLMRYTLRLLTTQQFQRAASLIYALERIRRAEVTRLAPCRSRLDCG